MIDIYTVKTYGWEAAIRGMRNPMNSWAKSDSYPAMDPEDYDEPRIVADGYSIGPNDQKLMMQLRNAGTEHRKFMRMIFITMDIKAPLYWWKEFDTYKVGTVADSCSTMHKIAAEEFNLHMFSCDHLRDWDGEACLQHTIDQLNRYRDVYLETKSKDAWYGMIQLLPSSYNQLRTVSMNYEVAATIYRQRRGHKLNEWLIFREELETLPFSTLVIGNGDQKRTLKQTVLGFDPAKWPTDISVSSEDIAKAIADSIPKKPYLHGLYVDGSDK